MVLEPNYFRNSLCYLLIVYALVVLPAHASNKIALVVGNDDYQNIPSLSKAVNDAHRIAQRLSDPELGHGAFINLLNQAYQISGMKGEDTRRREGFADSTGTINVQINLNGERHNLAFDRIPEDVQVVD